MLLFDLDGTLAPIVDDPAAARAPAPTLGLLDALAHRYRRVGVVSGRPLSFLAEHLPASVAISALYGLESRVDGVVVDHPEAPWWRPIVADVAARAQTEAPAGTVVEGKGLSITLHYRSRPDLEGSVEALAEALSAASGLEVRTAKMSVELHPPIAADKGTAVRTLVNGAAAVLYVGDDRGDLPAFAALADLATTGVHVARVAIDGPEIPPELAAAADAVVDGVGGVVDLLEALMGIPA